MNRGWRQVHHHGAMDAPGTLAQYQRAVAAGKRDATPPSSRFVAEYPQVPSGKVKKVCGTGPRHRI